MGSYSYLRDLVYELDSEDVTFYEEGEEGIDLTQYLTSIHFNHLTNPNEIFIAASQLCSFINAIEYLLQENKNYRNIISLDRLIDIENRTSVDYDKNISISIVDIDFTINPTFDSKDQHIISRILTLTKSEEFVRNILLIIAEEMTFQSMFQALDEIKYFLKSNNSSLKAMGFPEKGLINDFTHTANNFKSLGIKARHGNKSEQPPKIAMEISVAQKLFTDIIKKVINEFYKIEIPIKKSIDFSASDLFDNFSS